MRGPRRRNAARLAGGAAVALLLGGCWWPQTGAGPDRRAHNASETAFTAATVGSLHQLWSAPTDGPAGDPVTSVAGVHVEGTDAVYGFRTDGTPVWSVPVPSAGGTTDFDFTSVLVDGDSVLARYDADLAWWGTDDDTSVWLDAATGAALGSGISADALRDGLVVGSRRMYAEQYFTDMLLIADRATGEVLLDEMMSMQHESVEALVPTHLTLGATSVFQSGAGLSADMQRVGALGVRSFPREGAHRGCGPNEFVTWLLCATWTTDLTGASATPVVISEDQSTLYVGVDDTLHVLDAASGEVVWTAPVGSAITDAPAVGQGRVFVPTHGGGLAVLPADGCGAAVCAPTWTAETGAAIPVQPAIAGTGSAAVVLTGGADGGLDAFRVTGCGSATCPPLWSGSAGAPVTGAPAVSNGRIYVGTEAGLVAYGV